jgi:hypothetical protein
MVASKSARRKVRAEEENEAMGSDIGSGSRDSDRVAVINPLANTINYHNAYRFSIMQNFYCCAIGPLTSYYLSDLTGHNFDL